MEDQTDLENWTQTPDENTTSEQEKGKNTTENNETTDDKKEESKKQQDDILTEDIIKRAEELKEIRKREIPFKERNDPIHHARLRSNGMCAHSLARTRRQTTKANYHYDDRADSDWEEHFVEVHERFDIGNNENKNRR